MVPFNLTVRDGKLWELECLRGAAALYVVMHHTAKGGLAMIHPMLGEILSFGQEAVIVFFLLSGFVIHYASQQSGRNWSDYGLARVRRIYPIFIAALAITGVAYVLKHGFVVNSVVELLGNLLMLQDRPRDGTIVAPFLGNSPLWSLSYEAVFYALYPLVVAFNRSGDRAAVLAVSVSVLGILSILIIPNQIGRWLGYFIIWWAGVELCKLYLSGRTDRSLWITFAGLGLLVALWFAVVAFYEGPQEFGGYPILELRHFVAAILFCGVLLLWSRLGWFGFEQLLGPFAIVAPISYALYVVHYPVMLGWPQPSEPYLAVIQWTALLSISLLLSVLLEGPYQKMARKLFSRLKTARVRSAL